MRKIDEVRERYPLYKDVDDERLAQAVHKAHYSDLPYEEVRAKLLSDPNPTPVAAPTRSVPRAIADTALAAGQGALDLVQMGIGLTNIPTMNLTGKVAEMVGVDPKGWADYLEGLKSEKMQAVNRRVAEAEGILGGAKAMLAEPTSIPDAVARTVPGMLGTAGIARKAALKIGAAALKNPKNIAKLTALTGILEGAQTTGQIQETARAAGVPYTQSVIPALAGGAATAATSVLTSKIPGLQDAEVALATRGLREMGKRSALDIPKAFAKGVLKEGPLEEGTQSVGETIAQNVALGQPATQGVGKAWSQGSIVGGVMGGLMSGFSATGRSPNADIQQLGQERMTELETTPEEILKSAVSYRSYLGKQAEDFAARQQEPTPEFKREMEIFATSTDPTEMLGVSDMFTDYVSSQKTTAPLLRTMPVNLLNKPIMPPGIGDVGALRQNVAEQPKPTAIDIALYDKWRNPVVEPVKTEAPVQKVKKTDAEALQEMIENLPDDQVTAISANDAHPYHAKGKAEVKARVKIAAFKALPEDQREALRTSLPPNSRDAKLLARALKQLAEQTAAPASPPAPPTETPVAAPIVVPAPPVAPPAPAPPVVPPAPAPPVAPPAPAPPVAPPAPAPPVAPPAPAPPTETPTEVPALQRTTAKRAIETTPWRELVATKVTAMPEGTPNPEWWANPFIDQRGKYSTSDVMAEELGMEAVKDIKQGNVSTEELPVLVKQLKEAGFKNQLPSTVLDRTDFTSNGYATDIDNTLKSMGLRPKDRKAITEKYAPRDLSVSVRLQDGSTTSKKALRYTKKDTEAILDEGFTKSRAATTPPITSTAPAASTSEGTIPRRIKAQKNAAAAVPTTREAEIELAAKKDPALNDAQRAVVKSLATMPDEELSSRFSDMDMDDPLFEYFMGENDHRSFIERSTATGKVVTPSAEVPAQTEGKVLGTTTEAAGEPVPAAVPIAQEPIKPKAKKGTIVRDREFTKLVETRKTDAAQEMLDEAAMENDIIHPGDREAAQMDIVSDKWWVDRSKVGTARVKAGEDLKAVADELRAEHRAQFDKDYGLTEEERQEAATRYRDYQGSPLGDVNAKSAKNKPLTLTQRYTARSPEATEKARANAAEYRERVAAKKEVAAAAKAEETAKDTEQRTKYIEYYKDKHIDELVKARDTMSDQSPNYSLINALIDERVKLGEKPTPPAPKVAEPAATSPLAKRLSEMEEPTIDEAEPLFTPEEQAERDTRSLAMEPAVTAAEAELDSIYKSKVEVTKPRILEAARRLVEANVFTPEDVDDIKSARDSDDAIEMFNNRVSIFRDDIEAAKNRRSLPRVAPRGRNGRPTDSEWAETGIPTWHGGPNEIKGSTDYTLARAGEGEGGAAYGHGAYSADVKETAQTYADRHKKEFAVIDGERIPYTTWHTGSSPKEIAATHFIQAKGDVNKTIEWLEGAARRLDLHSNTPPKVNEFRTAADIVRTSDIKLEEEVGHLYNQRLQVEQDDLLDLDKPLSQQSEKVRSILLDPKNNIFPTNDPRVEHMSGQNTYDRITGKLGGQKEASEYLKQIGIPGLKYLDRVSRDTKDMLANTPGGQAVSAITGDEYKGTNNYVMFDDQKIDLTHKDGKALPTVVQEGRSNAEPIPQEEAVRLRESYRNWLKEGAPNDQENIPRLPGGVTQRQGPVQAELNKGLGGEAIAPGGNVQTYGEEKGAADLAKRPYLTSAGLLAEDINKIPNEDWDRIEGLYTAEVNKGTLGTKNIPNLETWARENGHITRNSNEKINAENMGLLEEGKTLRDAFEVVRRSGDEYMPFVNALMKVDAFRMALDGTKLEKADNQDYNYYDGYRDRLGLQPRVSNREILHEGAHALTAKQIRTWINEYGRRKAAYATKGHTYYTLLQDAKKNNDTPEPVKRLIGLYESTLTQLGVYDKYLGMNGLATDEATERHNRSDVTYGLVNLHEFVSEAWGSEKFRETLRGLNGGNKTSVWDEFVKVIKSIFDEIVGSKSNISEDMWSKVMATSLDVAMEGTSTRYNEATSKAATKSVGNLITSLANEGPIHPSKPEDHIPSARPAAKKPAPERTYAERAELNKENIIRNILAAADAVAGKDDDNGVIRSLIRDLAPGLLSQQHLRAMEYVSGLMGKRNHALERASRDFDKVRDYFARVAKVGNKKLAPEKNPGMIFAARMQSGDLSKMSTAERAIVKMFDRHIEPLYAQAIATIIADPHMSVPKLASMMLRKEISERKDVEPKGRREAQAVYQARMDKVAMEELSKIQGFEQRKDEKKADYIERISKPLAERYIKQQLDRDYFPMLWTRESHAAFSEALRELREEQRDPETGRLPQIDILTELNTPQKKAAFRARVEELERQGKGKGDNDATAAAFSKRPMEGSKGFMHRKYFTDIMDGISLGLKPFSMNPVDLVQHKRNELAQFIMGRTIRNEQAKYIPIGVDIDRPGWRVPKDRNFTLTTSPSEGAQTIGRYFVPNEMADILDAMSSQSLYNHEKGYISKSYKNLMKFGSLLNQFQLGIGSWFHAGFMYSEAMVSSGANLIKDLYRFGVKGKIPFSEVMKTAKEAAASIVPTVAYRRGTPFLEAYYNGTTDPRMMKIVEAFEIAGGRIEMERGLSTNDWNKFKEALYGKDLRGAGIKSLTALSEITSRFVMKSIVPHHKAAVFTELADRIIRDNKGKTLQELAPEFRQALNRVDARLGQVGYERLFMNNVAKNVIQMLIRAPGWTGGTILEFGGGFKDAAKFVQDAIKNRRMPEQIPDRVAYSIALITAAATMNSLLTMMFTGDGPEDQTAADYWAFRTGGVDEKGRPERMVLPMYTKDIKAYLESIPRTLSHKIHPMFSAALQMIENRDFRGGEIHSEEDPWYTQMQDLATYGLKQFTPFWMQGISREVEREGGLKNVDSVGSALRVAVPFVGITAAPVGYSKSAAEKKMDAYVAKKGFGAIPKLVAEQKELRDKIRRDLYVRGDSESLREARKAGTLSSKDIKELQQGRKESPLVHSFKHSGLSIYEAFNVYEEATPEEKKVLRRILVGKYHRARKNARVVDRVAMTQRYKEVMEEQ